MLVCSPLGHMTGFAEAHGAKDTLRWRWEVKSVNGKGLDSVVRMLHDQGRITTLGTSGAKLMDREWCPKA